MCSEDLHFLILVGLFLMKSIIISFFAPVHHKKSLEYIYICSIKIDRVQTLFRSTGSAENTLQGLLLGFPCPGKFKICEGLFA